MKTSKQLKEEISVLLARVEAISDLAKEQKRELSGEEKTEIDGIIGAGKKGDDYRAGKVDDLDAELSRAEKIEARMAAIASRVAPEGLLLGGTGVVDDPTTRAARVMIPAQSRYRYGDLKAYRGEHADERAFLAGMFYLATLCRSEGAHRWCQEQGLDTRYRRDLFEPAKAAHSGATDTAGGFLVPIEIEQAIVSLKEQYGVFRRFARRVPMASDTKDVPVRSSGLTGYWAGDNAALTDSDTTWGNAKLVAKKLYAFSKYSSEVSEDSVIDFGDMLTNEIAHILAYNEDLAGFIGDGGVTYGGIVGVKNALAAGSVYTAITGNTAFSTLDMADFESMIGKLPDYPGIAPAWYISKAGWAASMMRLADAGGGNTNVTLGVGIPSPLFLGYPVHFTQVMNSTLTAQISTSGICFFADLAMGALLGDRRGLAIVVSDQRYFEYDQLAIRGTERLDINIHSVGDASKPGCIIGLTMPGS